MKRILRNDREFEKLKEMIVQDSECPVAFDDAECPRIYPVLVIWRETQVEDFSINADLLQEALESPESFGSEMELAEGEKFIDVNLINMVEFTFIYQQEIKELLEI